MHDDDKPMGRLLRRREVLALFSASAASFAPRVLAQTSAAKPRVEMPDCVAQPEQTEGPYFVDTALERSDIRFDPATGTVSAGAPLALHFVLSKVASGGACAVLPRAQVHIKVTRPFNCLSVVGAKRLARDRKAGGHIANGRVPVVADMPALQPLLDHVRRPSFWLVHR